MIVLMDWVIVVILGLFGLMLGSFAGAQVWRLRARQLHEDKRGGYEYDKKQYKKLKPLLGRKVNSDRSVCLECGHQLAWFDLIPLVSWLSTGGKCRYCKKAIGWFEPLIEIGMALLFVASYLLWPFSLESTLQWVILAVWLASLVSLTILFAYDARWQILPLRMNLLYIGLVSLMLVLRVVSGHDINTLSLVGSVFMLGGIYALLYAISKNWVGDADRILGVGLGIALADWRYAFIALFLSNLIGFISVIPGMISGKLGAGSKIAFGPFMIIGALIAFFFSMYFIDWFNRMLL